MPKTRSPIALHCIYLRYTQNKPPASNIPLPASLCGKQLLQTSLDSRRVSAANSLNLLATLEEEEGRHSRDAVLGRDFADLVNVDLKELDVGVLGAQFLNGGRDGLARAAPLGMEVDDDEVLRVGDLLLPVLRAVRNKKN